MRAGDFAGEIWAQFENIDPQVIVTLFAVPVDDKSGNYEEVANGNEYGSHQ